MTECASSESTKFFISSETFQESQEHPVRNKSRVPWFSKQNPQVQKASRKKKKANGKLRTMIGNSPDCLCLTHTGQRGANSCLSVYLHRDLC